MNLKCMKGEVDLQEAILDKEADIFKFWLIQMIKSAIIYEMYFFELYEI